MAEILTHDKYIEDMIKRQTGILSGIYEGKAADSPDAKNNAAIKANIERMGKKLNSAKLETLVVPSTVNYKDSEAHAKIWNLIEHYRNKIKSNYNQFNPDDYYTLIDLVRIDITRRRMDYIDYTPLMTNEITNENFGLFVGLQEFLEYVAYFEQFSGNNEPAPLVQQAYGEKENVKMAFAHAGHTRSLLDKMFDTQIYSFQKVLDAIAKAWVRARNAVTIGLLPTAGQGVGAVYNALQIQAPVTVDPGTGAALTWDEQTYQTWNYALRLLMSLWDSQTDQEIPMSRVVAVVGKNTRALDLQKVTNGQLNGIGAKTQTLQRLAIDDIWIHKVERIFYEKKKVDFPGCDPNKGYLFVPGPSGSPIYTLIKRQLTREIGSGDVLRHEQEKNVWYGCGTIYNKEFYGTSNPDIAAQKVGNYPNQGFGYVVEINLPSEGSDT